MQNTYRLGPSHRKTRTQIISSVICYTKCMIQIVTYTIPDKMAVGLQWFFFLINYRVFVFLVKDVTLICIFLKCLQESDLLRIFVWIQYYEFKWKSEETFAQVAKDWKTQNDKLYFEDIIVSAVMKRCCSVNSTAILKRKLQFRLLRLSCLAPMYYLRLPAMEEFLQSTSVSVVGAGSHCSCMTIQNFSVWVMPLGYCRFDCIPNVTALRKKSYALHNTWLWPASVY